MQILQFSDTHLRVDGSLSFGVADTMNITTKAFDFFKKIPDSDQPDFYLLSGDVVDFGKLDAYQTMKKFIDDLPRPVYLLPGNHDDKENMFKVFKPDNILGAVDGNVCYTIDKGPLKIIVVDTTISHVHHGAMSDSVGDWLEEQLEKYKNDPVAVFTHHPPFKTYMQWMDEEFINVDRFVSILQKHKNLKLFTGHMHCSIQTNRLGFDAQCCPPLSMVMELDLKPGGGDRFFDGDPGYMLHHFKDGALNSHTRTIPIGASWSGPHDFVPERHEH
jgi:3',5'-cyclic AMP phosphodiesterase CpdA